MTSHCEGHEKNGECPSHATVEADVKKILEEKIPQLASKQNWILGMGGFLSLVISGSFVFTLLVKEDFNERIKIHEASASTVNKHQDGEITEVKDANAETARLLRELTREHIILKTKSEGKFEILIQTLQEHTKTLKEMG